MTEGNYTEMYSNLYLSITKLVSTVMFWLRSFQVMSSYYTENPHHLYTTEFKAHLEQ
jgi:hypothetical protein